MPRCKEGSLFTLEEKVEVVGSILVTYWPITIIITATILLILHYYALS
jgi:hypothetical protein